MKLHKIAVATTLAFAAFGASALDLGGLKMGGNKGNAEGDIKAFLQTASEAHQLTSKSAYALGQALLTKEQMQANQDARDAAGKIADQKEREAALAKAELDVQAQLSKLDFEAKANEVAKSNDKKQTAQLGASMYNFVLGMLKDKELVGKGSSLATAAASNPMLLTKAGQVKDVLASLSGQMGNMGTIASGLVKMSGKIKAVPLPTSATDKAAVVEGD
jgi:hypothetical protein